MLGSFYDDGDGRSSGRSAILGTTGEGKQKDKESDRTTMRVVARTAQNINKRPKMTVATGMVEDMTMEQKMHTQQVESVDQDPETDTDLEHLSWTCERNTRSSSDPKSEEARTSHSRILRHGAKAFDGLQYARLGRSCGLEEGDDAAGNTGDSNGNGHDDGHRDGPGQQSSESSEDGLRKGGTVDQESHIPIVSTTAVRGAAYPPHPSPQPQPSPLPRQQQVDNNSLPPGSGPWTDTGTETDDDDDCHETEDDSPGYSVYFVCQRGNDSQLAAQKLLERIQAEQEQEEQEDDRPPPPARDKRPWAGAWIGDVKGGFEAMERHQFGKGE